ncbi:MAG: DUF5108 domain-containing protein [Bacteroidaceae bacterium]|nr:DUF5108 domain-containing protein [Bacteroidaceae bacterium]
MKKFVYFSALSALLITLLVGCNDDKIGSTYQIFDDNPASNMLAANENFSEWVHVLEYSNMYNAINQATQAFTVFAPDNDAVRTFYAKKGVAGIEDLGKEYARALILHHTVLDSLSVENLQLKTYVTNLAGDRIEVHIDSLHAGQFVLSDNVHVYQSAVHAYNALMYYIDGVMIPLVETIYDRLADNPDYSIMREAVERTGWKETLDMVNDTVQNENGGYTVNRIAMTFVGVSNAVFAASGIKTFNDLVDKLNAAEDYTQPSNKLYEYVAYHALSFDYTLEDLKTMQGSDVTRIWNTLAENQVFTVTLDTLAGVYTINQQDESIEKTSFLEEKSNIKCKNGYLHEISGWLPVWEPKQSTIIWDLADYVEVKNWVIASGGAEQYQPEEPVSSEKKIDVSKCGAYDYTISESGVGGNSYAYVTYVNCKKNLSAAHFNDRVVFNLGYMGSVSMKTPTIVRGKYRMELNFVYLSDHNFMRQMTDGNGGLIRMTIDEDPSTQRNTAPYTTVSKSTAGVYTAVLYDEIEFSTTASHTFRFVVMDPAASSNKNFSLQFDCITFIPIE